MTDFLNFLSPAVATGLFWSLIALSVYITYRILGFIDITVDSSVAVGGAVFAVLLQRGENLTLAILAALAAGIFCGLATGALNVLLGIPEMLSGFLVRLMLYGATLKIMKSSRIDVSASLIPAGDHNKAMPVLFAFCAVTATAIGLLLWSGAGRTLRTARQSKPENGEEQKAGLALILCRTGAIALANGIAALTGALLCQYRGYTHVDMGRGAIIVGLLSVLIGVPLAARLCKKTAVHIVAAVLGGVIYSLIYSGAIELGREVRSLRQHSLLALVIALSLPYIISTVKRKMADRRRKKEAAEAVPNGEG